MPNDLILEAPKSVPAVSISSLSDQLSKGMGALKPVRLGVACMTKQPVSFERWLQYHSEALKVERFWLRIEDTPELETLLGSLAWKDKCSVSYHTKTTRSWVGQTERQADHVKVAIADARRRGLTHLLHIDDDELLYLPGGLRAFQRELGRAPSGYCNLHALTLEALVPRDEDALLCLEGEDSATCPFARCRAFRHRRSTFSAYGSSAVAAGKSFGALSCPSLMPVSPHHFSASLFNSAANGHCAGTLILPCHLAVVLHFESCCFARWRLKFTDYARHHRAAEEEARQADARQEDARAEPEAPDALRDMDGPARSSTSRPPRRLTTEERVKKEKQERLRKDPGFGFYQTSLHACLRLLVAEEEAAACPASVVYRQRVRQHEDACRDLWGRTKLEPPLPPDVVWATRGDAGGHRRPRVLRQEGITLIPPSFDAASGKVSLPPWHLDGLDETHAPSGSKAAPLRPQGLMRDAPAHTHAPSKKASRTSETGGAAPATPVSVPHSWRDLLARAGLPSDVWDDLVGRLESAQATGDAAMQLAMASRDDVDAIARRAGLPMGQRLRLKGAMR